MLLPGSRNDGEIGRRRGNIRKSDKIFRYKDP